MSIYEDLIKDMGSLRKDAEEISGIDDFLGENRIKLSSMSDLLNFARVGNDTLVHKAEKDLWKIGEDEKGGVIIERLFDPESNEALKV